MNEDFRMSHNVNNNNSKSTNKVSVDMKVKG